MKYNLKGNKIYFDEFFYLDLNKQTILEFDLKKRDEISEVEYRELVKRRVESMGYFLLGKRDYSERELYQKLLSKYREKDIIKSIIEKFIELGYLNDYDYAQSYVNSHNYSKKKMEFMLLQKGVNSAIIRDILAGQDTFEIEKIKKQWKKLGNKENDKKIVSLMRKGFQYKDIQRAIKEIDE